MLISDDVSKMSCHIQKVFCFSGSFLSYIVCVQRFRTKNGNSLSWKKYGGDNFTFTLCQRFQGQNISMEIGLIKLTEPSVTLT